MARSSVWFGPRPAILFVVCFALAGVATPVGAASVDLAETGAATCFDVAGSVVSCLGTGQDGDVLAGVEWPSPRFTNPDGTIPIAGDVVLDRLTGLSWLRDANCYFKVDPSREGRLVGWQQALDFVAAINAGLHEECSGGQHDWRLPNVVELESLVSLGQSHQDTWLVAQGFQNVVRDAYYTSTSALYPDTSGAFTVGMGDGEIGQIGKAASSYYAFKFVWPVRGGPVGGADAAFPANPWQSGQASCWGSGFNQSVPCAGTGQDGALQRGVALPSPRFSVTHCDASGPCASQAADCDGSPATDVVVDELTGLVWPRSAGLAGGTRTWQGALDFASDLRLCGRDDWRLPNRKELLSLVHFDALYPVLPPAHPFVSVAADSYWSATSVASAGDNAWVSGMPVHAVGARPKTEGRQAWPVAGGALRTPGLYVNVWGPRLFFPGQRRSYVVEYANLLHGTAADAVVQLSLPGEAELVDASPGAIYRAANHEVFWRLGDVPAGEAGYRSVSLRYRWGLPEGSRTPVVARMDAADAPTHVLPGFARYLSFAAPGIATQRRLSPAELEALLRSSGELRQLRREALSDGFTDPGIADEVVRSDGSRGTILYLLQAPPFRLRLVKHTDERVWAETIDPLGNDVTVAGVDGGLVQDLISGAPDAFGAWADEAGPQSTARGAAADPTPAAQSAPCVPNFKTCMVNCLMEEGYNWGVGMVFPVLKELGVGIACTQCLLGDQQACVGCANELSGKLGAMDEVPGVGEFQSVVGCLRDCDTNTGSHVCTEDLRECASGPSLYRSFVGSFGVQMVMQRKCNTTTCLYDPPQYLYCPFCESCIDGACVERPAGSAQQQCFASEVAIPRDPNEKHGPEGDVVPGQTLTYAIDYENVGAGTADGVFVVDRLDDALDEATLVIGDGGTYGATSRLLTWSIGELAAHAGGSVHFAAAVREGTPSGTEIVNRATVHFPSVPEITPTNPVVSRVFAIAARAQALDAEAGIAVPVTLDGSDAGGASLTFRIVDPPLHGTLGGSPPALQYTAADGFAGLDRLRFVASNGIADSAPADVVFLVSPSTSDTTPPFVLGTDPPDGASSVPASSTPIVDGGFAPVLAAGFSEAMDGSTITEATFSVVGSGGPIAGIVRYDDAARTAYLVPAAPLVPGASYVARLDTSVRDAAGNALVAPFTWSFATGSSASPSIGTVGTQIRATGSRFGATTGKVLLGKKRCKVLAWSDNEVTCRVALPAKPGTYDVAVVPREPRNAAPLLVADGFTYVAPQLGGVTPPSAVPGQEITVAGWHFGGPRPGSIRLEWDQAGHRKRKSCKVVAWSMDPVTGASSARCAVPRVAGGALYDVSVKSRVGTTTVTGALTVP